jgi:hypothetical protein
MVVCQELATNPVMSIRHAFLTVTFAVCGLLNCSVMAGEPTYTKRGSLPPLRITYPELTLEELKDVFTENGP